MDVLSPLQQLTLTSEGCSPVHHDNRSPRKYKNKKSKKKPSTEKGESNEDDIDTDIHPLSLHKHEITSKIDKKDAPRKQTKVENHQTINTLSQRQIKKRVNLYQVPSKSIPLVKPPSVLFNNKVTGNIEEMDIDELFEVVKEQFNEDTEYLPMQLPEDDKHGNIEYKLKLIKADERRLQELECQMLRRLDEGVDTCFYHIGLEDNGNPLGLIEEEFFLSLRIISHVATKNDCSIQLDQVFNGEIGRIAFVKLKQRPRNIIRSDIRIQLLGETGSGKTTLIKTIYFKESCCSNLNTQTTQIQQQYLCFDSQGKLLSRFPFTVLGIEGEVELATKIISFVDIGGKQKDRKYFVQSYCSRLPNYGLLVISARLGFSEADRLKIKDAVSIGIVFFIVITNIDASSCSELGAIICQVKEFINQMYTEKVVQVIYRQEQIAKIFTESFRAGNYVPIFLVSSKMMTNIKLVTKFLSQLPDNRNTSTDQLIRTPELTELTIYNPFEKSVINTDRTNENLVLQGTVLQGELTLKQQLLIGPDQNGLFRKVQVEELMVVKSLVIRVQTSQICTARVSMSLKDKKQFEIRKGQVLVDPTSIPRAAYEFLAELTLFDSITSDVLLRTGFQPVVTFQSIRQSCKIMVTRDDLKGQGYRPLTRRHSLEREITSSFDREPPILGIESLKKTNSVVEIKGIKSSTQGDKKKEEKALVFSKNLNKKFLRRTKSIDKIKGLLHSDLNRESSSSTTQKIELKGNVPVIVLQPSSTTKTTTLFNSLNKFQPERKNYLRMRFCYRPELIKIGQVFFIDESSLKAVGVVKKVFY